MIPAIRPLRSLSTAILILMAGGCIQLTDAHVCMDIYNNCSGGSGGFGGLPEITTYAVYGWPPNRLSAAQIPGRNSFRVVLMVGDTVRLYLIGVKANSPAAPDTVRNVEWRLTDSSVAHLSAGPDGVGILAAVHAGRVGTVLANAAFHDDWSCTAMTCVQVGEVVVVAP